ncbi:AAA family ATPase, partial [Pseudomonas corrugata]|uniref:AAA family ATPase n=1 Tax=Pseudomonas corrugata TaxID=47879 RepID=UPI0018E62751
MKVVRIEVNNFRLLKKFSLDLESNLSLVLGKNNSGKTSLLSALEKFINSSEKRQIVFDDFNVDLKAALIKLVSGADPIGPENAYTPLGITLKLYIEYDGIDNLSPVSQLIMSLDPDDNHIVLGFEYLVSYPQLTAMRNDYNDVKEKYDNYSSLFLNE